MISELFMIMLAVVLTEHFIFSVFLGVQPFIRFKEKPSSAAGMGAAMTIIISAALGLTWLIYNFIWAHLYFRTIAFILIMLAFIWLINMLTKKYAADLHQTFALFGLLTAINCTVISAVLISADSEYNFVRSIIHGAFSAVGFTLAVIIFTSVRERLRFANPPPVLKGAPIVLIAAGLVAMAIAGFGGIDILRLR